MYADAPTGTYPVAAAGGIRIDSGWVSMYPDRNPDYWLTFTNFRSCLR
jgi:hypothetical protein